MIATTSYTKCDRPLETYPLSTQQYLLPVLLLNHALLTEQGKSKK
jgi:hypothetical protein